jgi:hypothetical protein
LVSGCGRRVDPAGFPKNRLLAMIVTQTAIVCLYDKRASELRTDAVSMAAQSQMVTGENVISASPASTTDGCGHPNDLRMAIFGGMSQQLSNFDHTKNVY